MTIAQEKTAVKVVFGTMTFGKEGAEQSRVFKHEDCQSILDVLKRHGHTELDTARAYGGGSSEEYLSALKATSQGFHVSTKVFPSARMQSSALGTAYDHTASGVQRAFDDSTRALGPNEPIDIYYLHAPDREVPLEETLSAINDLYTAGKFKRFGISNYTAEEVERIVQITSEKNFVKPTVYQGLYNSVARAAEEPLIPILRKHGIAYYCYNPLAGGFFTGRIMSPDDAVEKGSRFDKERWQGQMYRKRYYRDEYFAALSRIAEASQSSGLSMPEIALRWMQHHSKLDRQYGDAIIVGASSTNHIEQNLIDFEKGPLPSEVVQAVDEAWQLVKPNAPPYHF